MQQKSNTAFETHLGIIGTQHFPIEREHAKQAKPVGYDAGIEKSKMQDPIGYNAKAQSN